VEQHHKGVIAIVDEACLNVGKVTDEVLCCYIIIGYFMFCQIFIEECYGKKIFLIKQICHRADLEF
jgi:hypothetical protein